MADRDKLIEQVKATTAKAGKRRQKLTKLAAKAEPALQAWVDAGTPEDVPGAKRLALRYYAIKRMELDALMGEQRGKQILEEQADFDGQPGGSS